MNKVEWIISEGTVDYETALQFMDERVNGIIRGELGECIWLVEHPPIYTGGTTAQSTDLITPDIFPVYKTGRGGEYTYHGPGQRVAYIMLDLNRRKRDVRWFVGEIEKWIIDVCASFDIKAERRSERVGLWVKRDGETSEIDDKIAAIGIRLRRWVSLHGVSLNVSPNLEHYEGIVPCGISVHGVTSFKSLGKSHDLAAVDRVLQDKFYNYFNAPSALRSPLRTSLNEAPPNA